MKTIWKFPFAVSDKLVIAIEMPKGAKILHVEVQSDWLAPGLRGQPCLWALVDPLAEKEWHVFEEKR